MNDQRETESPPRAGRKRFRITAKVSCGLALLLACVGVVYFTASVGFSKLNDGFRRFESASRRAERITAIDRDVIELQRNLVMFTFSGSDFAKERIESLGVKLKSSIEDALAAAEQEASVYHLTRMQQHIATFLDKFATVKEERQLRKELVQVKMRAAADQIQKLQEASQDAEGSDDDSTLRELSNAVSIAELSAFQFVNNPDSQRVDQSLRQLDYAIRILGERKGTVANQAQLNEALQDFRQSFLRAVQATRGYLYLVSVVMAGEVAEFAYQSERVLTLNREELGAIKRETDATAGQAKSVAVSMTLAAVLLGLVLSWGIVKTIVQPISAITRTFTALSAGSANEAIPGLNRRDEIGELARAAETFQSKNRQTEQLLTESERLTQELQASNADLNSFAYVASHDLRSPLRGINTICAWILEDDYDSLSEESQEHFKTLQQRVVRMDQLLDDLLSYSRVGRENVKPTTVNTALLIDEIKETIDWPSDMELTTDDCLPVIDTDRPLLHRVLLNLMTNAVKYRSAECPVLHISADVRDAEVEFQLRDNGPGIAEEFHERIFQMFQRLHSQDQVEGSGMGLALIKKIIETNGGRIGVESRPGEGATFRFTWTAKVIDTTATT